MIGVAYKDDFITRNGGIVSFDVRRVEYEDDTPYDKTPLSHDKVNYFENLYQSMLHCYDNHDLEGLLAKVIELEAITTDHVCIVLPVTSFLLESPLIPNLVSLIQNTQGNTRNHILGCINNLTSFSGKLLPFFLNANLVEILIQEMKNPANQEDLPFLFDILRNITSQSRLKHQNFTINEVLNCVFSEISLSDLVSIARQSKIVYDLILAKIFFNATLFEPAQENQDIILKYLSEQYNEMNEDIFRYNIWTLSQLTSFPSFSYDFFVELGLHKFVDDMLCREEAKLIYPALLTISNIYKNVEPEYEFHIQNILKLALNDDPNKETTKIASLDTLRRILSRSQKYTNKFTQENIIFKFIKDFNEKGFFVKVGISQLIIAYFSNIDHGIIRQHIENHVLQFFCEIIQLEDSSLLYQLIVMMIMILEKLNDTGGLGFFEVYLSDIDECSMNILLEAQNSENERLPKVATFLISLFDGLPNARMNKLLSEIHVPKKVQREYEDVESD